VAILGGAGVKVVMVEIGTAEIEAEGVEAVVAGVEVVMAGIGGVGSSAARSLHLG